MDFGNYAVWWWYQRQHVSDLGVRLAKNVRLGSRGVDGVQGSAGAVSCVVGSCWWNPSHTKGCTKSWNQWGHLRLYQDASQDVRKELLEEQLLSQVTYFGHACALVDHTEIDQKKSRIKVQSQDKMLGHSSAERSCVLFLFLDWNLQLKPETEKQWLRVRLICLRIHQICERQRCQLKNHKTTYKQIKAREWLLVVGGL